MKKSILVACFVCAFSHFSVGQIYKMKVPNSPEQRVEIELPAQGVVVEGYAGDEIIISGPAKLNPVPDRAKGLKPIYYGATDNTGIGLSAEKKGNTLFIQKATRQDATYHIKVPSKVSVKFEQLEFLGGDDIVFQNLDGDVEVKTRQVGIKASKLGGAFVANSISGNIEMTIGQAASGKTIAITTISGDIDLTMPAGIKSSMTLKSFQGEIFTDFNLERGAEKETGTNLPRIGGGNTISGNINGGGMPVNLSVISGNIYVRKAK